MFLQVCNANHKRIHEVFFRNLQTKPLSLKAELMSCKKSVVDKFNVYTNETMQIVARKIFLKVIEIKLVIMTTC